MKNWKDVFKNCKVQRNYGNLLEYIPLKREWNMSIAAIVMRAFELRVINLDQFKKLQKSISYRGWRKKEIGDEIKEGDVLASLYTNIELNTASYLPVEFISSW